MWLFMVLNPKVSFWDVECLRGPSLVLFYFLFILTICAIHLTIWDIYYLADDTSTFMSHKDPNILQSVFNNKLDIVSDWLHMNKLSVNAKKTNFMMFTNKNIYIKQFHIKLAGSEIKHVPSLKF